MNGGNLVNRIIAVNRVETTKRVSPVNRVNLASSVSPANLPSLSSSGIRGRGGTWCASGMTALYE